MSTFVSLKCPHCQSPMGLMNSSSIPIGNPFLKCRECNKIVINAYKKEWINIPPSKRKSMNFFQWFNRKEFKDAISASLRRTETIEYVDQLKKAGFLFYPLDNYKFACKNDSAVTYSLHNYFVPQTDAPSIEKKDLPKISDFTIDDYDTVRHRLMVIVEDQDRMFYTPPITHQDRVYFAYRSFKPSLLKALFPDGITLADFIIQRFAEILSKDLTQSHSMDYFFLLVIYYELMRAMLVGFSKEQIIAYMRERFDNYLTEDSQVEGLLSMFK